MSLMSALSAYPHLTGFQRSLQELWHGADQPAEYTEEDCLYYEFWCYMATPQNLTSLGNDRRETFLANNTNQM